MKNKKWLVVGFAAIMVAVALVACGGAPGKDAAKVQEKTPPAQEAVQENLLCPPDKIEDVDFRVLNTDSRPALEQGYMYKRLLNLKGDDESRIARDVATAFLNTLNVPLSNVPEWFIELREGAIAEAVHNGQPVDYDFLNKAFAKFLEDPKYSQYADPEQKFKLFVAVNNGLIKAVGDPFASYIAPVEVKLGAADSSGTFYGIGAGIARSQNNEWELGNIGKGGPAEKAGLKPHDIILKVNGKSAEGCTVQKLILNVRGPKGSKVNLTVGRNKQELDFTIVRDLIKFELVESWPAFEWPDGRGSTNKTLAHQFPLRARSGEEVPSIAYIKIHSFETQAGIDFYYILRQMPWERISGLIIDLRNNPGGSLAVIEAMTGYFLPPQAYILLREEAGGQRKVSRNVPTKVCFSDADLCLEPNLVPKDLPIVVLINNNSFSGSEVMGGALQDHKRATLVGERSGGKGTVNQYFTLRNGEYGVLYLAIEIWRTPKGRLIEPLHETKEGGLVPDVIIEQPLKGFAPDNDENIFRALEILTER
ncbi:MAG: S41 family peptidase [Candidatus Spechtbacterales bacterium]